MKRKKIITMLCVAGMLATAAGCTLPFGLGQQETEATEEEVVEETTTTTTVASVFVIKEELDYEEDLEAKKEAERKLTANEIIKDIDEDTDVDEVIEKVVSTDDYKEANSERKRSIIKRLMTKLVENSLISDYYYESGARYYTYTYLDETEGRISID